MDFVVQGHRMLYTLWSCRFLYASDAAAADDAVALFLLFSIFGRNKMLTNDLILGVIND